MKLKYGELRYSQYLETPKRYSIHSNITLFGIRNLSVQVQKFPEEMITLLKFIEKQQPEMSQKG